MHENRIIKSVEIVQKGGRGKERVIKRTKLIKICTYGKSTMKLPCTVNTQ
jgi:hypothetical protein